MTSLNLRFDQPALPPGLRWHCEPKRWTIDPARRVLRIEPDAATDFWQRTHYGFEVDNGHFLYAEARGDFILETRVTFHPVHQYDQAGLMVRVSPTCWIKTSVEFEPDGPNRLGAVVTSAGFSDWSTQPLAHDVRAVSFRIRAQGADCIVDASLDGNAWHQIRMAHLHERRDGSAVAAGLYACSPKGSGYRAEFSYLALAQGSL